MINDFDFFLLFFLNFCSILLCFKLLWSNCQWEANDTLPVSMTTCNLMIFFKSAHLIRSNISNGQKWVSHNNFSCEKGFSADFVSRRDTCCMYGSVLHWSKKNCELTCGILTRLYLDFKQVFFNINYFFQIQIFH